jgi:hypothetical protein
MPIALSEPRLGPIAARGPTCLERNTIGGTTTSLAQLSVLSATNGHLSRRFT